DRLCVMPAVEQGARRGERVIAARADRRDRAVRVGLGLQHVARAGEHEARLLVSDDHHRFEAAQISVHAPILGELDAGARELTRVLLELRFESFEQREGVGGGAGEARDHLALAEPPDLLGVALHDGLAEADLAIAGDDGFAALLHHDNRRRAPDVATLFFFAVHSALDDGVLWEHLRISPRRGKCRLRSAAGPPATVLRTHLIILFSVIAFVT